VPQGYDTDQVDSYIDILSSEYAQLYDKLEAHEDEQPVYRQARYATSSAKKRFIPKAIPLPPHLNIPSAASVVANSAKKSFVPAPIPTYVPGVLTKSTRRSKSRAARQPIGEFTVRSAAARNLGSFDVWPEDTSSSYAATSATRTPDDRYVPPPPDEGYAPPAASEGYMPQEGYVPQAAGEGYVPQATGEGYALQSAGMQAYPAMGGSPIPYTDAYGEPRYVAVTEVSKKPATNKLALISNLVFYAALILVVLLALSFAASDNPNKSFLGYRWYWIKTGSMEPVLPQGALAIVNVVDPEKLKVGDDVTFLVNTESEDTYLTHRVVEVNKPTTSDGELTFRTKGVANESIDPDIRPASTAIGRVVFSIPYIGYLMAVFRNSILAIAIAIACMVGVFVLLKKRQTIIKEEQQHTELIAGEAQQMGFMYEEAPPAGPLIA
jgi:signal peptidase